MSNVNINLDPDTGMPELPEGYRWNVSEKFVAGDSRSYVYVTIVKLVNTRLVDKADHLYEGAKLSYGDEITGRKETRTHTTQVVEDSFWQSFLAFFGFPVKTQTESYTYEVLEVETWHNFCWTEVVEKDFDWTPESILDLAFEVYEMFLDKTERGARKQAAIGNYPPKKRVETNAEG